MNKWVGLTGWGIAIVFGGILFWLCWQLFKILDEW